MRYPAKETARKHETILDEAARLFRERGFAGVGVADIMKAAGLTHGAFYAHFDSKDALTAEALTKAFDQTGTATQGADKQGFLDGYLSENHRDNPGKGCAIAALGPDIARSPATRAAFTQAVEDMLGRISEFDWQNDAAEPRANAITLLSAAVGAVILARAVDDPALSQEILVDVRKGLSAL